jgi:uncharacterized protein YehS (DUF1456 family)
MATINTNEILYKIQKALNLTSDDMLKAYGLEDYTMEATHLESLLMRRQEKDFKICSYEELGIFLDGLVSLKRGVSPKKQNDDEAVELTNNLILKKLRIALELKDAQMGEILSLADVNLSKQQLASLFRNESHKNYRECSDELLIAFTEGLDKWSEGR